jgi:chloramphenicol O-acetyltransferase
MGRSDGTLIKDIPAFDRLIPYMMNRRYDATNFAKVEFDMTNLHQLLRDLRAKGHKVGVMDAVIAAYARLLQKIPELNRFIANKKIYQRNHVCVSFAILRRAEGDEVQESAVKVYMQPDEDILSISQKIRDTIKENEQPQSKNNMDRFVDRLMSVPLLPGFLVGTIKWLDKRGILPRKIIALSPFHTSMFISNLASIQMNYVYHHLYDFGTTSLFITLGMPRRVSDEKGNTKRMMTLGISLDERICTGAIWAKALFEFKRTLENPEQLLGSPASIENLDAIH